MNYDAANHNQYHEKKNIAPTLQKLGLEHKGNGHYHYAVMDKMFDFSACSLEGCVIAIYKAGHKHGKNEIQEQVKDLLKL